MTQFCAAYGCANRSSKPECKAKGISFHSFPLKDPPRLMLWLLRIRRAGFFPSKHSTLCSTHFTEHSFVYQPFTNRRLLAQNAVPSIFVFNAPKSNRKKLRCEFQSGTQRSSEESLERSNSTDSKSFQADYLNKKRPVVIKL